MPRKPRINITGYYHVISRGVERRNVFLDDADFEKFLELLEIVKEHYVFDVHSFCLMTNHYHLLIQTHEENLSDAMRYLNSHYAVYFNKKYSRSGHLWQGRYKSYYLFDEQHFWMVSRYIEQNPIVAGMVNDILEYKYQSMFFRHHKNSSNLLHNSKIFTMSDDEYNSFICVVLKKEEVDEVYKTPAVCYDKVGELHILDKRLSSFFEEHYTLSRNKSILKAISYGYSQTQLAQYVGLSKMAISKIVKLSKNNAGHDNEY